MESLAALRASDTVLTADAGYHREANLAALAAREVTALIADPDMRKRDERFADREHHTTAPNPLNDKWGTAKKALPLLTPRGPQRHERVCRRTLPGREARWCALCVARPMFAYANQHRRPSRRALSRARGRGGRDAHDADAAAP